jgi:HD superfamily phosphohydrolase
VSAVEEMAFSQLMLASYIYQHQKVLATDALIQDIVEGLSNNEKLTHPCDFLYYCDDDIFGIYSSNLDDDFKRKISQKSFCSSSYKKMEDIVKRIKERDLPKRAFTVNYSTVLKDGGHKQYIVSDIADRLKEIVKLREEICEETKKILDILPKEKGGKQPVDLYDIHIAIPKTSIAKDLSNALVINNVGKFVSLSEIVRLSDWADAFAWHKWNAYIFSKVDILPMVSIASKVVLQRHGLQFDENTVFASIKSSKKIQEIRELLRDNFNYIS